MKLKAEWVSYMKSYRLYEPTHPQDTVAYEDDLIEAETHARHNGYDGIILCDSDTMKIERY